MAKLSENKKRGFSLQGFDVAHYRQTEGYVLAIEVLYNQAILEFTQSVSGLNVNTEKPFSFSDYPLTKGRSQKIINDLAVNMKGVINRGSREQWLYASEKNDEFLARIMDTSAIPKRMLEKYQDKNLEALKAFQSRKVDGLGLSDRIWNYTGQMKTQMELGIDIALGDGIPASKLAKELKQYLVNPDKLFRRVRDKHGNLVLSKNAKAFHPGQGKYRSSYKNAMRLTRSEINMAYRESDQLRWQQLDFVVGFEVKLSNNHTLNGKPFADICDDLKGKYPKTFKFTGWHPQCRCHAVPIMEDYFSQARSDDRVNQLKAALNGTEYQKYVSKEAVTDVPDAFKDWIAGNADRARNWKSQPYFIRNNFNGGRIEGGLSLVLSPAASKAAIKPILIKTAVDVVKRTNEVGKDWFFREFKRLEIVDRAGINGATDRNGIIWLNRERTNNVIAGMEKLASGAEITFDEADALATYWHEVTHCRNKMPVSNLTVFQRQNMELANELVSRKTLPEFYRAMGADNVPYPEFMTTRRSTGYNQMVCNYEKMLDAFGVDKNKGIETVKDCLFNKPYSDQLSGLVDAIHIHKTRFGSGGILGKNDIKNLIRKCGQLSESQFEEVLMRVVSKKGDV